MTERGRRKETFHINCIHASTNSSPSHSLSLFLSLFDSFRRKIQRKKDERKSLPSQYSPFEMFLLTKMSRHENGKERRSRERERKKGRKRRIEGRKRRIEESNRKKKKVMNFTQREESILKSINTFFPPSNPPLSLSLFFSLSLSLFLKFHSVHLYVTYVVTFWRQM